MDKFKTVYTIFVFVALAAFDNIIIGLFPPLFSSIANTLNVKISALGFASGVNILVTCISSVIWGYLAGKFNRKRLIITGTVIWSIAVFFTSISKSFTQLFVFQIFTGIGLGCIASIGFSVLTDYIPHKSRGMLMSLWGMSQGLGGIACAMMASLMAPALGWRRPFEIVSVVGLMLIILYLFIKAPALGESEPELQELIKKGYNYDYKIEVNQLHNIVLKHSNILLFLQAFFFNITTGTLIWLPTLYISKIQHEGFNLNTSIIAPGYLFGIFQLGGMTSAYFGHLGDKYQRKSYKGRAIITAVFTIAMMPLYILMFYMPMNNLQLPNNSAVLILIALIKQIFVNPWMTSIFVLSFLASATQSANTPNWLALITDVNLPEHRGTAFSLANLASGLGRTIGNSGVGVLLSLVSLYQIEPHNYIITQAVFELLLIPSSLCYIKMTKSNVKDIEEVKSTLSKRGNIA